MVGKRHALQEITAKLAQANELAAKGKTTREISKALGVSIMTYHRWKKSLNSGEGLARHGEQSEAQLPTLSDAGSMETIRRLELENSRLRRLVTDMLLEKLKLEEDVRVRQEARLRRPDKS
jgi:transposase